MFSSPENDDYVTIMSLILGGIQKHFKDVHAKDARAGEDISGMMR